jgi:cytochrome P450
MTTNAPEHTKPAAFDPFGMEFRSDPFAYYPWLVENSPGFITMEGVPSAYVASSLQCRAVLRNFKLFSSLKPPGLPGMERIDFFNGQPVMNYSDPPDHTRRRMVVNASFTPGRIQRLDRAAATFIDQLLEQAAQRGEVDALADICKPLSIEMLLGALMNVAEQDRHIFFTYLSTLPLLDKLRPGDPKPKAFLDAWAAGEAYCREAIARARREHSDNLIGLIAAAASEGGSISDSEMMAMLVVLFSGGISTMAGAATASLLNLAQNPAVIDRVRREPALADNVLEESMRLHQPVMMVMRFATADTEIGDKRLAKGTPIYVLISAANHDPAVFPDPNRFDIDRSNLKDHVAFGFGMHTCIGNAITRSVVPMLIRSVVERFPSMRLAYPGQAVAWEAQTPRARHIAKLPLKL